MREIIYPAVYATDVQTVVDAGGTITEKFRQIVGRWEAFAENDYSVTEALHAAILDPGTSAERLAELRVLAEAATTATPVAEATVRNGAAAEVLAALRVEYRSVAASNYEAVRSKFNAKADELVKALETIDAEASAEEVVKAPAKTRAAWAEGPALAVELDELVNVLHTAAILAGKTEPTGHHNSCLIGLTVDAQGLHRRRVWEAWAKTTGRGGRWRELWKLGATIEAPALEDAGLTVSRPRWRSGPNTPDWDCGSGTTTPRTTLTAVRRGGQATTRSWKAWRCSITSSRQQRRFASRDVRSPRLSSEHRWG